MADASYLTDFGLRALLNKNSRRPEYYFQPGSELPNGAILIASRLVHDKDRIWIVLCWYPTTEEYATWVMTERDGATFWGHYFQSWQLRAAVDDFAERR